MPPKMENYFFGYQTEIKLYDVKITIYVQHIPYFLMANGNCQSRVFYT